MEKHIKVIGPDTTTVLFEGLSSKNRFELKKEFGEDITVFCQQTYVVINDDEQTYNEALESQETIKALVYNRDEFMTHFGDTEYKYVTYSQRDLDKQKGVKKNSNNTTKSKPFTKTRLANFSAYLYTSLAELEGLPKGLTSYQRFAMNESLGAEDAALNEYAIKNNLSINDEEVRAQQIEACVLLVGRPSSLNSYIKMTKVKWIEKDGLIKNDIDSNGFQTILLMIDVTKNINIPFLTQVGYFV